MIIFLIFQAPDIPAKQIRFSSIINPIQYFIFDRALKLCLISRKDIAKECTKYAFYSCICKRIFAQCGLYQLTSDNLIDYGCEAAWAGFYDGVETIPKSLARYACIDACYRQVQIPVDYFEFSYPKSLKAHAMLYSLARVLMPLYVKKFIGAILDSIFDHCMNDEEENNQLSKNQDFLAE